MDSHLRFRTVHLALAAILSLAACSDSDSTEPQPSLRLEVEPASLTLIRGATDTVQVTVIAENGGDVPVTLSATPSAADVSAAFESNPTTSTSELVLTVSLEAEPGARTVMVTGSGGGATASAELSLEIEAELPGDSEERYGPGVVGEIRTIEVEGEPLTYEVIDGLAIFQGDMILGDADEVEARLIAGAEGAGGNEQIGTQTAICNFDFGFGCGHWTDGVIGYAFANDWGDDATNLMMRQRVVEAMEHWEARTSLRFVERTSGERVVFRNADGCSSDVGKVAITGLDPQWVNISTGCDLGSVIHEIGHAVGLWHEHSRTDAGEFVTIDFGAVEDFRLHQFFSHAIFGVDPGPYDYGSIMHYGCTAFSKDSRHTIEPTKPGVTCEDIGQRDSLSAGDILGAYTLYPPRFTITGAEPPAVDDRFELSLSFDTEPVRDDYIVWRSDRVSEPLGTGPTLTLTANDIPNGAHVITASIEIFNTVVTDESIELTLENTPPSVELSADGEVDLNRVFYVTASVTDAEDGACPYFACDYHWTPEPESGADGPVAGYRFTEEGPQTIEVVVTDAGGASDADTVTVDVVNTPPRPVIAVPADGSSFSEGSSLTLSGSATDINEGPGPEAGTVSCIWLEWSSSDPTDVFDTGGIGCNPTITFGSPGTRTIKLIAIDAQQDTGSAEVEVDVTACSGNCAPDVSFIIDTPQDYDDALFEESFDEPGFYRTTEIRMTATVNDADEPPDSPVHVEWTVEKECTGTCPSPLLIGEGDVTLSGASDPATTVITWRPEEDVSTWPQCVTDPRRYIITLEATDARGASNRFSRKIMLACPLI
ncbi:MAG TPA: M12 family metallopeptidase [Longimicrobiales bacterium]